MKVRIFLLTLLVVLGVVLPLATPHAARADGVIVPPQPCIDCPPRPCPGPFFCPPPSPIVQLNIRYHHVTVTIRDQVAVTRVDQVFFNPNSWAVEGTYIFPLPKDAAVSAFTLWVDGKPVQGEILNAGQARQKYQEIVSSLRDPALLEYAGQGAVQAHVFPIPPQGERRIELEYTQALAAENGLVRYVYPLSTEKFSAKPLEEVAVSVQIEASTPIRAVYSPSHTVDVTRESENRVTAGYEAKDVLPDSDFALYYSLGTTEAFHLLTYREAGDASDPDGFFLLLLAPRPEAAAQPMPKDLILVLDRSGSMQGEKFQQAQEALRFILGRLNPEDRFNAIAFSSGLESFAPELRPASEAGSALEWVDQLGPRGSTDINRALLEAASMADRERPTYLIFLTDGLPTVGEVDRNKILGNFAAAAPQNLRLFVFGVGYDVDTFLLDTLAQDHHGLSTYVLPGERLDEILSAFYERVSTPVLTNLSLDFGGISVYDLYPSPLPDLFRDSQIILVGRYREGGQATVSLSGQVDGQTQTFTFPDQVFSAGTSTFSSEESTPRLWATRKIGYLLNQIRLNGPDQETIDQIVRLSIRFGIVTPYTSYLVTENVPLGSSAQNQVATQQYGEMLAAPAAPASGQEAVQKAADQGSLAAAEAPRAMEGDAAGRVQIVGTRTFVFTEGKWIDTAFDPQTMQTVKVAFLSSDYFALAEARPELAAAFALGPQVIAFADGKAYEVRPAGEQTGPVSPPPTPAVQPTLQALDQAAQVTPADQLPSTPTAPAAPAATAAPSTPGSASGGTWPCAAGLLPLLAVLGGILRKSFLAPDRPLRV